MTLTWMLMVIVWSTVACGALFIALGLIRFAKFLWRQTKWGDGA